MEKLDLVPTIPLFFVRSLNLSFVFYNHLPYRVQCSAKNEVSDRVAY